MSEFDDLEEFFAADKAREEASHYKRERDKLAAALEALQVKCDLLTAIDSASCVTPKWLTKKPLKKDKAHHGIANLLVSDTHFDEVVKPEQISGVNAYNRDIAYRRWQNTVDKMCELAKDYISGITYDGAHIWLNGDIFSGNIHEEIKETNEAPIMATIDFWVDPLVAGLKQIRDEFGNVHVSGRVGNHGRNTRKPIHKNRVQDNFDWLFYRILQREFRGDGSVTWDLPLSADGTVIQQYETRFMATHGDQFHGGSGISGILTPLALGDHRKAKRQMAVDDPYDYLLLGHFHQYTLMPRVIVNGSLKGYDEYAFHNNFGFEQPQQAFWVTTPEHGISFHAAIKPQDRKKEGW